MTGYEKAWLAGLLEGEGCFTIRKGRIRQDGGRRLSAVIQVNMNDGDVLNNVAHLFQTKRSGPFPGRGNSKPFYVAYVSGQKAIDVMQAVHPLMGERRSKRIQEILDKHGTVEYVLSA